MSAARNAELARIHCLKRDLGLDDDAYRTMLRAVAQVGSAKELDDAGRRKVLVHLGTLANKQETYKPSRPHPGKPNNLGERGELRKIEAFLAEAGREWAYADGILKHMFQVERCQFASGVQLRAVLAALHRDAKRHDRRTE